MLFAVNNESPKFQVFVKLNEELGSFLLKSIPDGEFRRELFTAGAIGEACWENSKENNAGAQKDLTKEKFAKLFTEIQRLGGPVRQRLRDAFAGNQDLAQFFAAPSSVMLEFLPSDCLKALKSLASHLYCATKDLAGIIGGCAEVDIGQHFRLFRAQNGLVCLACGMQNMTAERANIPDEDQWRADYDHQLCKSKYPLYAVHPDNLIPLCDVCNQDAKKSKDLFVCPEGESRQSFYPYSESAYQYVDFQLSDLDDPEPVLSLVLNSDDDLIRGKLATWNDVYEIKNLVEGQYRNIEALIIDEINPTDLVHLQDQVEDKAREPTVHTLRRMPWAFWKYKFFNCLGEVDLEPFWEKCQFEMAQAADSGEYILNG